MSIRLGKSKTKGEHMLPMSPVHLVLMSPVYPLLVRKLIDIVSLG